MVSTKTEIRLQKTQPSVIKLQGNFINAFSKI